MITVSVKEILEVYRKVQDELWLTPHIVYTATDEWGNVIDGSVTVRKPLAPSGTNSDWLPEDVSEWVGPLNDYLANTPIPQSIMDQYYGRQALDDAVSDLVSSCWHNGTEAAH